MLRSPTVPSDPDADRQMSLFDVHPDEVQPAAGPMPGFQGLTPAAAASPAAGPVSAPIPAGPTPGVGLREVVLQGQRVSYALQRARRRSIGFVVTPQGLSVRAPRWVGVGEIESALREKADWILRKLRDQAERARRVDAGRIAWGDGASLPFLGETLLLVLDHRVTGVQLNALGESLPGVPRLTLHVGLPHGADPSQIRDAVQSWLQRQARRVFEERCAVLAPRLGVQMRRMSLSSATTRWGSASADGSIRLNWRLVHFGLPVIDYVVTHELAHLREMNHSPAFWAVVRQALPGFEQARDTLREQVVPPLD